MLRQTLALLLTLVTMHGTLAAQTPPKQLSPALVTDVQWKADMGKVETLMQAGRFEQAEQQLHAMMDRATVQSLQAMAALGQLRLAVGDAQGALPFLANAAHAFDALGENKTRRMAHIVSNLGVAFEQTGRLEEAEGASTQALEIFVEVHGERHREVAIALNNLAGIVHALGRRDDELTLRLRESAIWKLVAAADDSMRLQSMAALAWGLTAAGRAMEARPIYDEVIPLIIATLGADHLSVAETRVNRGWCLQQLGEYDAAREDYAAGLASMEKTLGRDHPGLVEPLRFQATLQLGMDLPGEAAVSFERAAALLEASGSADLQELTWLIGGQVTALKRAGRTEQATRVEARLDQLSAELEQRTADSPVQGG